jgi:hypothetical protein
LQALPHDWADQGPFQKVIDLHNDSIEALEASPVPKSEDDDALFTDVLNDVFENLKTVGSVPAMLHGLQKVVKHRTMPPEVNKVVTDFLTLRTGMRFLIQHHMALRQRSKVGFAGIFQMDCSPANVARKAAEDSRNLCRRTFGQAPEIVVRGDLSETLPYVPAVLQYMLSEIFKNACRAVVETHRTKALPPVVCDIEGSADALVITISDEGCGMSQQQVERMWDFMSSTWEHSAWDTVDSSSPWSPGVLAGYGVGCPVSRMYAQYFGGDIEAASVEGYGTEVQIHLCRSRFCREVLPTSDDVCSLGAPFWDSSYGKSSPVPSI